MVYLTTNEIKEPTNDMGGLVSDRDLELMGVRQFARLEIPIRAVKGVSAYRDIADLLRGLATSLEVQARRADIPERSRVFTVLQDVAATNRKIKQHCI
jgi:hypothetical protein